MIAVVTAFLALALLAFAALVVDLGHVRDVRRQAQNAADSAALAAGNNLYLDSASPRMPTRVPQFTKAVEAAQAYATANLGVTPAQWTTCTDPGRPAGFYVPASSTECISFDQATAPVEVRVKLPVTSVNTPLGGLLGRNRVDVVARANAKLTPNPKSKCALVLGARAARPAERRRHRRRRRHHLQRQRQRERKRFGRDRRCDQRAEHRLWSPRELRPGPDHRGAADHRPAGLPSAASGHEHPECQVEPLRRQPDRRPGPLRDL